ncbi:lysophospholipid acyltransferase family protein [Fulvivirga lutea]|uniref:Lysophospholipid acyltransferase family protein n=1 Tax=Fulvivirga lutea TaxID=2810512 RepID=A0A974WN78_9BACT|nr:lysophospholipid acyltransferase family protein [Fulvivirga lutea]QSE98568.1 lysophospholipid acyltransferase family protein [Fulvivirga lutea]
MIFLKLLSRLPLPVLYLITDTLYVIIYYVVGYRKKVVKNNLVNSFPNKSDTEINKIRKEFYVRFSEYIAETIKALTISEKEMKSRVTFTNVPVVEPYAQANQSIILAGSHQFNWEWALLTGCLVLPFPVDAVYKKLSNKAFDELMLKTRAKFGGQPIESKSIIRSLIRSKERTKAVAIMADQSPKKSDVKYWTKFMNQDTAFFTGPEQIAAALKYPVFFYRMERKKRGHYTVELIKLTEPPYEKDSHEILELYVKYCQKLIEDDPAGYLWSHKRWKLKKESD